MKIIKSKLIISIKTVLIIVTSSIALQSNAQDWKTEKKVNVVFGLIQPIFAKGFNIEGNYIHKRLIFDYSHGASLDLAETTVNPEEIEQFAKLAHVHHNIIEFPDKYDTLLGERGVNLSGGQKQRISIARALIRKPKLLLLDDCLSAVDTETEEIILKNLHSEKSGNSTVIVSHRISTIRHADYILYLEKGEITEQGTHEQLLGVNGKYAEMYRNQLILD